MYPPEDIARLNALVEPKAWDERQERWRRELILTFGFLGLSKAELTAATENPDMIDAWRRIAKPSENPASP